MSQLLQVWSKLSVSVSIDIVIFGLLGASLQWHGFVMLLVSSSDVLRHCLMAAPHVLPLDVWEIQQSFDVPGIKPLH